MSGGSAPGFGKDPLTPCHGDSLVDHSFQSLKSKEIRDSMSPPHDIKFHSLSLQQSPNTGWDVQTSSEVTPDGRAYRTETVATTDGVEKINGGLAEFKGRNEQRASASHQGDDMNFVKTASESSNTHLQENVVIGDEQSGRTETKMSSTTTSSSSQVVSSSSTTDFGAPIDTRYLTDNTNRVPREQQHNDQHLQQQQQSEYQAQHLLDQDQLHQHQHNKHISDQSINQQQKQQYTEEYNRNRQSSSTSHNVETRQQHEKTKRYVDMDKASPEYQQHVQYLMAQPGEIISNTVEYPKPNVKMITTVKRLPDGTIVKNKRYETEEVRPTNETISAQKTSNHSNAQFKAERHHKNEENSYSRKQTNRDDDACSQYSDSATRRSASTDVVDNVETARHIHQDRNVPDNKQQFIESTVKQSSRRFSTETTFETVEEFGDHSTPGNCSKHTSTRQVSKDFSTHGFPSVKSDKPTQEYPTDRPHAPNVPHSSRNDSHDFPSVKPKKLMQGYSADRPQVMRSEVQHSERQFSDSRTPDHGFPAVRTITTPEGDVNIQSSERTHSSKFKTNSERVIETEVVDGNDYHSSLNDTRSLPITQMVTTPGSSDVSSHRFPSIREPSPDRKCSPRYVSLSRDFPSSPSRHQPTKDFSTHGFPSVRSPAKGSKEIDVVVVTSENRNTGNRIVSKEHIIKTEALSDDYNTPDSHAFPHKPNDFSTHGFPSVKSTSSMVQEISPKHGTASKHALPSARSPTRTVPDATKSKPEQLSPESKRQSTTTFTRRPTATGSNQRLIQKEKEVDAAHRAFAASLRSSSPVDSPDHHRQTPRSSVSSAKTYRRDMREGSHDSHAPSELSHISASTVTRQSPSKSVGKSVVTKQTIVKTRNVNGSNETIDLTPQRSTKSPSPSKTITTTTTTKTTTTSKTPTEMPKADNHKPEANTFPINEPLTITKTHFSANDTSFTGNEVVEEPCLKKHFYQLGPSDNTAAISDEKTAYSPALSIHTNRTHQKNQSSLRSPNPEHCDEPLHEPASSSEIKQLERKTSPLKPHKNSNQLFECQPNEINVERRTVVSESTFEKIDNKETLYKTDSPGDKNCFDNSDTELKKPQYTSATHDNLRGPKPDSKNPVGCDHDVPTGKAGRHQIFLSDLKQQLTPSEQEVPTVDALLNERKNSTTEPNLCKLSTHRPVLFKTSDTDKKKTNSPTDYKKRSITDIANYSDVGQEQSQNSKTLNKIVLTENDQNITLSETEDCSDFEYQKAHDSENVDTTKSVSYSIDDHSLEGLTHKTMKTVNEPLFKQPQRERPNVNENFECIELVNQRRVIQESPDGSFISKSQEPAIISPTFKKKGLSHRETFEERCRHILGMESDGDTQGTFRELPVSVPKSEDGYVQEKKVQTKPNDNQNSVMGIKIEDCVNDEPLYPNNVKETVLTAPKDETFITTTTVTTKEHRPMSPSKIKKTADQINVKPTVFTKVIEENKNTCRKKSSDLKSPQGKSIGLGDLKTSKKISRSPSPKTDRSISPMKLNKSTINEAITLKETRRSESPERSQKKTVADTNIRKVKHEEKHTFAEILPSKSPELKHVDSDDQSTHTKRKSSRSPSPKTQRPLNSTKLTDSFIRHEKRNFPELRRSQSPELKRLQKKNDNDTLTKISSRPRDSNKPKKAEPKITEENDIEIAEKRKTSITSFTTTVKSPAKLITIKKEGDLRNDKFQKKSYIQSKNDTKKVIEEEPNSKQPKKPSPEKPMSTIKERLRSSPRNQKPKVDDVDSYSSPETSPNRLSERRRSSNISVHTEIIIDHVGPKNEPFEKNPLKQKPLRQTSLRDMVNHNATDKPTRKLPVTERKESAPVQRVTRKDKDAIMSRSTSENIIKVTGKLGRKPEMSSLSPSLSPKPERRPIKCFTTKTINLTSSDKIVRNEDTENVIIDIQHAKSSREPSPDKIVPTPVPIDFDIGKPRYPDVVQEPEDEPRKKSVVKHIPIFEEDTNEFISCQISEVNTNRTIDNVDYNDEILHTPTIEAPVSLDYSSIDRPDEDCLMSVHEKVTKFTHTAEELKKPKASNRFNREFDVNTSVLENDDCLLTVDEKVSKFIKTAENVAMSLPVPRVNDHEDVNDDLSEDHCILSLSQKVNKCTNSAKLEPSLPQKSPELVARIERHISRQSEPDYPDSDTDDDALIPFSENHTNEIENKRQKNILSRPSVWSKNTRQAESNQYINNEHLVHDGDESVPMIPSHISVLELEREKDASARLSVIETQQISLVKGNIILGEAPTFERVNNAETDKSKPSQAKSNKSVMSKNSIADESVISKKNTHIRPESPQKQSVKKTTQLTPTRKHLTGSHPEHIDFADKKLHKIDNETVVHSLSGRRSPLKGSITSLGKNDRPKEFSHSPTFISPTRHSKTTVTKISESTLISTTPSEEPNADEFIDPILEKPNTSKPSPIATGMKARVITESVAARRNIFEKKMPSKSTKPSSPNQTGRRPSYMEHTKSSLEHTRRDSLEINKSNYSRKSSVDEDNHFEVRPNTSVKFDVPQRTRKPISVSEDMDIENIFDLEELEHLLEVVTSYELRRRIRSQIRLVKKNLQNTRVVDEKRPEAKTSTSISSTHKSSAYSSKVHREETDSCSDGTHSKTKCERSPSPKRNTLVKHLETEERRSNQDARPPTAIQCKEALTMTKEGNTICSRERSHSPDAKSCQEKTPYGKGTTVRTTYSSERRPAAKPKAEEKTPIWADRKNILKNPSSVSPRKTVSSPVLRTSTTKTARTTTLRQSKNTEEDSVTSSYGIGPTDENGLPLFGIKALKKKKQLQPCETTEVTGYTFQEEYYSDDKTNPVVERKGYINSTNADDLKKNVESKTSCHEIRKFQQFDKDFIYNEPKGVTPEGEDLEDFPTSTKYVRRGSVKEMSEKLLRKESSQSITEKCCGNYPRAGLILRSSLGSAGDGDSYVSTSTASIATKSTKPIDNRAESMRNAYDVDMLTTPENEGECDLANTKRDMGKKSSVLSQRSFLNSTDESKTVTSVGDVLERMRNADNVMEEGDTAEDKEARALLNKFLGASVIMKGIEAALPTSQTKTFTISYGNSDGDDNMRNQAVKTTRITKTIKSGSSSPPVTCTTCDIEEIWDEKILKELLEQSTAYEERRRIRARLRELMAEREDRQLR